MDDLPLPESTAATILLIDDNNKDRSYYAEHIRMGLPNCHVAEARDGHSGLELYRSHRFDCIVTELDLPDMSGFELLLAAVPRVSQSEVAVIILARIATKALADIAHTNGVQAFLLKRSTAGDELVPVIQKAIATVRATREDQRE